MNVTYPIRERKRKALVFDCDGTLVNSVPKGFHATCQVFKEEGEAGIEPPTFEDFFVNFRPPAYPYYHARGVTKSDEEIWEIYLRHANHDVAELFPDTMASLEKIASRASELNIVYLGVLSANKEGIVRDILEKRGIYKFFHEVKGDIADKSTELERIVRTHNVERDSVIWVGDFPSDMRDGEKAGVISIGIAREMFNIPTCILGNLLSKAGANNWIEKLGELENILGTIL